MRVRNKDEPQPLAQPPIAELVQGKSLSVPSFVDFNI